MARIPRIVVPGIPHHITQRGNNRQQIFFTPDDHRLYLRLLRDNSKRFQLSIWGYCLMPNHVHIIAVPHNADSLARTFALTHAEFTRFHNSRHKASGHLWQNRFYSCAMDDAHTWAALAYVEQNPLRAGLAPTAEAFQWSSANAHLGGPDPFGALETSAFHARYNPETWRTVLATPTRDQAFQQRLHEAANTGRPLGAAHFIESVQSRFARPILPKPLGRPAKRAVYATAS